MNREILEKLQDLRAQRQRCTWVRDLRSSAEALVWADGSLGDQALADSCFDGTKSKATGKRETADGRSLFCQTFEPQRRLIIIGAVHIAQTLAPLASQLGYKVRVIDPRPTFADPLRFPGIDLLAEWPEDCLAPTDFDTATDLCLLSHDPKIDDPALLMALKASKGHGYLGALGSKKTGHKRLERMREHGVSQESLSCLHSPIGLNIGSSSPAEIAVAIAAELVAFKHSSVV